MPSPVNIRVLCADDHPLVRDGIAYALQQTEGMQLVGEATNGLEAVEMFGRSRPDVTLMDLQMPGMNGIDAMIAIRSQFPSARIVVLTTYAGDVHATRALKAGAVGFLLKASLRTELIETIRLVHAGRRHLSPGIAAEIADHNHADQLSLREIEVLRHVASGCSNRLVAEALLITEDTVKAHMKSILSKLGASDRTHAVTTALKRGVLDG